MIKRFLIAFSLMASTLTAAPSTPINNPIFTGTQTDSSTATHSALHTFNAGLATGNNQSISESGVFRIKTTGGVYSDGLFSISADGVCGMGDWNGNANATSWKINDTTKTILGHADTTFQLGGVTHYADGLIYMTPATGYIAIGDDNPDVNGTTLEVNDVAKTITAKAVNGYFLSNLTDNGFLKTSLGTGKLSIDTNVYALASAVPSAANPTASIGLTTVNGSASTFMRSDAAPPIDVSIVPTWTGIHTFSNSTYSALFTGGNVGIGTTSPLAKLSIVGASSAGDASDQVGIMQLTTGTGVNTDNKLIFGIHNGDYSWIQALQSGDNERNLILNPFGANVGIGTTNPGYALDVNGAIHPASASGLIGTTTNDNVNSGGVGEYIASTIASGSAVSLTSNTAANVTSISLTSGDWDVEGNVNFSLSGATTTAFSAGINSTSATIPTDGTECYSAVVTTLLTDTETITVSRKRFSLSGTTTIYLVGQSTFSAGSESVFGAISARRVR